MLRAFIMTSLLIPFAALAGSDCEDDFLECKDDCVIQYGGSIRVEVKKQYEKCMKKCTKKANTCTERVLETRDNSLDEGALDKSPSSRDVDSDGMPTRGGDDDEPKKKKKKKKVAAESRAADEEAPAEEPAPKHDALREDEVPKSARTSLKSDDSPAPKPDRTEKKKDPESRAAEAKSDDPVRENVIKMELKPRREEEDLRDDRPGAKAEEPAPPPKKKEEPKKEPPKKKEEDHDDLRYY